MTSGESPIKFVEARPMGIGRLTCCAPSSVYLRGMILGGNRGLFHVADIDSRPRRIRRWPVVYVLSGKEGAVCYEEADGGGRLAILDADLEELSVDSSLARRVNPKAYWNGGLIIHHQGDFVRLDLETGHRRLLARFVPTRAVSPFARVAEGFDFIAIQRGPQWPTKLHRLTVGEKDDTKAELGDLAQAEDPIFARHLLRFPNGEYLVVPQGQPVFEIYRIFEGNIPGLRMWSLIPIPGEDHPVGLIRMRDHLYAAVADSMMIFKLPDEFVDS